MSKKALFTLIVGNTTLGGGSYYLGRRSFFTYITSEHKLLTLAAEVRTFTSGENYYLHEFAHGARRRIETDETYTERSESLFQRSGSNDTMLFKRSSNTQPWVKNSKKVKHAKKENEVFKTF